MLDLNCIPAALRAEGGVTRRFLLAYAAALAAVPATRPDGARAQPRTGGRNHFTLGVASGEPHPDSVLLWTRLAPSPLEDHGGMPAGKVEVRWEVLADDGPQVIRSGAVETSRELGHAVHVVATGLQAGRWYRYRFHYGDETSPVGRTRTTPALDAKPDRLRFAFASCQNYEDGFYTAHGHLAADPLDLVVFLGDYIYEFPAHKGPDVVRPHHGGKCTRFAEYRARYAQYKSDPLLQRAHANCPWLVTWDDHEVEGNYANDHSKNRAKGVTAAEFLERRAAAYRAFYEHMPVRPRAKPDGPNVTLYHRTAFGQLATFHVLDTRQYRTPQPNGGDPAPIGPAAESRTATLLGGRQFDWLKAGLAKSDATWNVLAQQVMMAMIDRRAGPAKVFSTDSWSGYVHERTALVKYLADAEVKNPVVLSGDIHSNWANELRVDDREGRAPVVAAEFVGTSISSKGDGKPGDGAELRPNNPCLKYHDDHRGYVRCDVTPALWLTEFRRVPVVSRPNAPVATAAAFVVQAGRPGVTRA